MEEPAQLPLKIAYYVTPHGLGHATRALEVTRHLLQAKHEVVIVSGPAVGQLFQSQLPAAGRMLLTIRKQVFDSGALQPHAFTVDQAKSLEEYQRVAVVNREAHLSVRAHPTCACATAVLSNYCQC